MPCIYTYITQICSRTDIHRHTPRPTLIAISRSPTESGVVSKDVKVWRPVWSRNQLFGLGFGLEDLVSFNIAVNYYKYQLSQMNPRDGIVLWTEVDYRCEKLAVDRRRYCQLISNSHNRRDRNSFVESRVRRCELSIS